jgi:hypothetical protein
LTVSEVIQEFALSVVGIDFECQIERSARSNDPKILIEHNERFSNRVDDSVCKYPGILDLGELFSEHVSEHGGHPPRGGAGVYRTLSLGRAHPLPKIPLLYTHYVRSATQFDAWKRAKTIPESGLRLLRRDREYIAITLTARALNGMYVTRATDGRTAT